MFFSLFCLAIAAQFIQGSGRCIVASQCSRTNKNPLRHCTSECIPATGCRNSRKKCLCDGDCGYSCVYPTKSCSDPGAPRNGNMKGLFRFGEKVSYTCDKCYKLKGPAYRHCQADQTWTDSQPTCEPVTCSFLQNPTNGFLTSNSQQCGTTVQYHCDHDYRLKGSPRRRCQSDGTWSGKEPICEVRPCGRPILQQEARIRLQIGNVLIIGCKLNYVTVNFGVMQCNQNNSWESLKDLICVAKGCADPGTPQNGYKQGLSYFIDDVVTFTCDSCYRLVGSSVRTCLKNGSWSNTQPQCVLRTCPSLDDTAEATTKFYSQACGAIATYTCKDNKLDMLGSGEKVCNESGIWVGVEPKCVDRNLNIALGKPAFMSSHWRKYGGPAKLAVDGNRRGRFFHTKGQYGPWWKVDLLKVETISTVIVVNRRDCCTSRINGFKVSIGNNFEEAEKNTECGGRSKAVGGENIIHCPKPLRGRFVAVYLPKNRYNTMVLFKVEVYRKRMEE